MMRDCEAGEKAVKDARETYLPMPEGFTTQPDSGAAMYNSYQTRAQFPDILQPTLAGMVGVIHRLDADITGLDDGPLEYMWSRATKDGLPLELFHERITAELLLTGRFGILTDVPSDGGEPYLVGYDAEAIINWSPELNLFVLDDSKLEQTEDDEFSWAEETSYRVLRLKDGTYTAQVYQDDDESDKEITPQLRGGKKLDVIPFVISNPREQSTTLKQPPLVGVARSALAIYRLDADYRHQLYRTGQETLFILGTTEHTPTIVGAGVSYGLPAGCDAKYVGCSGVGINSHRQAIMDERQAAVAAGVKLFEGAKAESAEALRLRAAAGTATLTMIAKASAAALEKALRFAAQFVGQDPEEIVVKPNLQFIETVLDPAKVMALVQGWQAGAYSKLSLFESLQRGEIISQERSYDDEQTLIEQEAIDSPQMQQSQGLNGGEQQIPSRFVETGAGLDIQSAV